MTFERPVKGVPELLAVPSTGVGLSRKSSELNVTKSPPVSFRMNAA
jgi:hypothetical protein